MAEKLKALIIDDDEIDRLALNRAFKKSGENIQTTEVWTGSQGIESLKKESFDIIFLDFLLPDMNGLGFIQEVRAIPIQTPIIVFTGYEDTSTAVELMKAGASDFINKALLGNAGLGQIIRNLIRLSQAEKILHESEERYRDLFENANDLIQSIDPGGRFIYVNHAWKETLGYTDKEIKELSLLDVILPSHHQHCQQELQKALEGKNIEKLETVFVTKEGREILVEGSINARFVGAKAISTRGIFRDITERKQAEEALKRSEARTQSILQNMLEGLLTTNENGIIESANSATESVFGYPITEIIGRPFQDLMVASEKNFWKPFVEKSLGQITEHSGLRKNGESFPLEISLFEFDTRDKGDNQRAFALNARDISGRQKIERLKKDLISTVSHELRTPLTSIRGSLALLNQGVLGEFSQEAYEVLSIAERNTSRLINLINDILDLDRLEYGQIELELREVPLDTIFQKSLESVGKLAEQFQIEFQSEIHLVYGDEERLIQVLVNLLSNALKFSPKNATIHVTAKCDAEEVEVAVQDFGCGIPSEHQKQVFGRFKQVNSADSRNKGGTGLGLAICKTIIEEHGGSIGVKSQEGKGSTFWFRLPYLQTKKAMKTPQ